MAKHKIHMVDFTGPDRALCGAYADSEDVAGEPTHVTCNTCLFTLYPDNYYEIDESCLDWKQED